MGLLLLVVMLLVLGPGARRWFTGPAAPTVPAGAVAAMAPAPPAAAAASAASASAPPMALAAAVARAARAASDAPAHAAPPGLPLSLELCGVGRVSLPEPPVGSAGFELLPRPLGADARAAAWPRVLARLDASPALRDRAAALVLRASGLLDADASLTQVPQPRADTAPALQALVELARRERDPAVMRWALQLCDRALAAPACQGLTPRDLLALAPDDAAAWLRLAQTEPAAAPEAFAAAAAPSSRYVTSNFDLPAIVDAAFPPELPGYLRLDLAVAAIGIEMGFLSNPPIDVARRCQRLAATDQAARSECAALATMLVERSDSLIALTVGRAIGERLQAWPAERLAAIKAEEAREQARSMGLIEGRGAYGCEGISRLRDFMVQRARTGELGALRAASAASR
jgi:hypothetical protein